MWSVLLDVLGTDGAREEEGCVLWKAWWAVPDQIGEPVGWDLICLRAHVLALPWVTALRVLPDELWVWRRCFMRGDRLGPRLHLLCAFRWQVCTFEILTLLTTPPFGQEFLGGFEVHSLFHCILVLQLVQLVESEIRLTVDTCELWDGCEPNICLWLPRCGCAQR